MKTLVLLTAVVISLYLLAGHPPCKVDAATAIARAQLGRLFNLTVPDGSLIVERKSPAHVDSQYLFALNCQQRWTTNGHNAVGSHASLSWDTGELLFESFTADDVGTYTFPMEQPRLVCAEGGCGLSAPTMFTIELASDGSEGGAIEA